MNIPKFRRTLTFIDEVEAPCLTARMLNSVVPGLAAKEIAKEDEVPVFDVYLRAKDPKKITKWEQEMLERLFEKEELKVAIEEGMKDFQKQLIDPDPDDLADYIPNAKINFRNGKETERKEAIILMKMKTEKAMDLGRRKFVNHWSRVLLI